MRSGGESGQDANTRRTQASRVRTAARDTAAVSTIVWNPWNPPAQTWSSALPPAAAPSAAELSHDNDRTLIGVANAGDQGRRIVGAFES